MGDYGKILFQNALADRYRKRQWEREMEAQLQRYYREKADLEQRRTEDREWQVTSQITSGFMQLYQSANTPAEKEVIRNNWLDYAKTVSPRLRDGLSKMLGTSPLSVQGVKDAEWAKANRSPAPPKMPLAENPYAWASYYWDSEAYKKSFLRERRGIDYALPTTIPIDDETYTYLDDAGKVQLEKYGVKKQMLDKLSEGTGMSGYALSMSDGWDRGKTVPLFRTDPNTGIQQQHLMLVQTNVLTGKTRTTPLVTGEAKRGKPDRMGDIREPEQRVDKFISYLLSDKRPGDDPAMGHSFDRIRDAAREIADKYKDKDATKAFEEVLNRELGSIDNQFTYIIEAQEGRPALETKQPLVLRWKNRVKLAPGAAIIPIPGRPTALQSKDGKSVKVIVDEKNNRVFTSRGKVVGTIQFATELIGSHTMEELASGIE